jgi:hypothetical protein
MKGGFTKAERCEYMSICKEMLSRDPSKMTKANQNSLFHFLKVSILKNSETFPPEQRDFITSILPTLFENPEMLADPNYLGAYNIVAFQISILFTIFSMKISPEDLELLIFYQQVTFKVITDELGPLLERACSILESKGVAKKECTLSTIQSLLKEYVYDPLYIKYDLYQLYDIFFYLMNEDVWRNYSYIREYIVKDSNIYEEDVVIKLLYPTTPIENETTPLIVITVIGFLYIQEIVETSIKNIYYCGMVFTKQFADAINFHPIGFLMHDINHARNTNNIFIELRTDSPELSLPFKSIFELTQMPDIDKKIRYSVLLILFYILHENVILMLRIHTITAKILFDTIIAELYQFIDLNHLGKSIPPEFRGSEESIVSYLQVSVHLFMIFLNRSKMAGGRQYRLKNKRQLQTRKVARGSHS